MFTFYDTRTQQFYYFLVAYNANMEKRVQDKLLTQIVKNLQSSPIACLWFAANLEIAANSHIT